MLAQYAASGANIQNGSARDAPPVALIAHRYYYWIVGSTSPKEPKARTATCPHGEATACLFFSIA
jgi:hypothetical protein